MTLTSSFISVFLISSGANEQTPRSIIQNNVPPNIMKDIKSTSDNFFNIEYEDLYKELSTYNKLKENWDGYNGIRPSDDIINTAKLFLNILKNNKIHRPRIMVSGNGEIALFWKKNENYIEIDFDIKSRLSFFYELENTVYGEDDVVIDGLIPQRLKNSLSSFFKATSSNERNSSLIA